MRKLHTYLLISFLLLATYGSSQKGEDKKRLAKEQIQQLRDGVLLIRLQTKSKTIEILKAQGYEKRAEAVAKEQKEENLVLAQAFGSMNFCKVYFFYSDASEAIQAKDFKGNILNSKLEEVNTDSIEINHFLVGAVGKLPKNYSYKEVKKEKDKPLGISEKPTYQGGSDLTVESFYVMDSTFNVLSDPFPYYQRYHPIILTTLTNEEVSKRIEAKWLKFYEEVR